MTSEGSWALWRPRPAPLSYQAGRIHSKRIFERELWEQLALDWLLLRPEAVAHGIKSRSPLPLALLARKRKTGLIPNTPKPLSPSSPRSPTPVTAAPAPMSQAELRKRAPGPREHMGVATSVLMYGQQTAWWSLGGARGLVGRFGQHPPLAIQGRLLRPSPS